MSKKLLKLIFLDIDGTVNSDAYCTSKEYLEETSQMSEQLIMLVNHYVLLDPKALGLVNDLVDRSGATVVLSSTWRAKYSPSEITKMMQDRGATFTVSDSTPVLHGKVNSSRIPRGKEISAYLAKLEVKPESFVILDDHDDMLSLGQFLVKTTMKLGLTSDDVERALKILNRSSS
jgi:hypothetical protein